MIDPLSTVMHTITILSKIWQTVNKVAGNKKKCDRIRLLVWYVYTIVAQLQQMPEIMENELMVRVMKAGLDGGLQRACDLVTDWEKKNFVRHALEADKAADELQGVYTDMLVQLGLANFAASAYQISLLHRALWKLDALTDILVNHAVLRPQQQIISGPSMKSRSKFTSTDVHQSKSWIATNHEAGHVKIWDYEKSVAPHGVCSVKFMAQVDRLAVGDRNGYIHVCYYTDNNPYHENKFIKAYDTWKSVDLLAVDQTNQCLLSWSSASDGRIKLWYYTSSTGEWVRNQDVDITNLHDVRRIMFNPWDTNTFAWVTDNNRVKVWDIKYSRATSKLNASDAGFFFPRLGDQQSTTVTFSKRKNYIRIHAAYNSKPNHVWNLKTNDVLSSFAVRGHKVTSVACHPKLPIFATTSDDGTVCFWDATTCRVKQILHTTVNSKPLDSVFVPDANELIIRLVFRFEAKIAILETQSQRTGGKITGISRDQSWRLSILRLRVCK